MGSNAFNKARFTVVVSQIGGIEWTIHMIIKKKKKKEWTIHISKMKQKHIYEQMKL